MTLPVKRRNVTRNLAVLVGYYLLARSSAHLAIPHTGITAVWPSSGLAVAALFAWGWEMLPGLALGSLVFNLSAPHLPVAVALGLATGNLGEYAAAAAFLRRFGFDPALSRIRDAASLIGLAAFASPLIAATVGTGSEWLGGILHDQRIWLVWSTYWTGDATGILIAMPVFLLVGELRRDAGAVGRWTWGLTIAMVIFAGASWGAFLSSVHITDLLFALGTFIAIRYRTTGASVANAVIAVIAEIGTTNGHGPFGHMTLYPRLLELQAYGGSFAVMVFALAAATNARLRLDRQVLDDKIALESHVALIAEMARESSLEREQAQREHDRLQAQLYQSLRLESLGKLSGGIAHDFNNLLAIIINYASYVTKKLGSEDVNQLSLEECRETRVALRSDLEQIVATAERAADLTHQLLAFARQEEVSPVRVELNTIVIGVVELLQRTLGEHVSFILSPSDIPLTVIADPGQIEQVLINLAVNARDAMPEGGRLVVSTDALTVGEGDTAMEVSPGDYGLLTVADQGSGMNPEVIERAFDPFFSTKPTSQGTGLGLSTVYGIVTGAGGRVWIESKPGQGTKVSVLIPLADQPPVTARLASASEGVERPR